MSEFYSPTNFDQVVPYVMGFVPKWLLLGGPADAYEAQLARKRWPGIKIVGVELNPEAVAWQHKHGWPKDCPLHQAALSDCSGLIRVDCTADDLRHGRVASGDPTQDPQAVMAVTWDDLDRLHGPFEDAILWLDIETHEWEALQGAKGLLARNAVWLVNVEMQKAVEWKNQQIDNLLRAHDFRIVGEWNWSADCWDRVYARRPL